MKAPLLLIQGVDDPRVPAGEAIQIHDSLKKRGVPVELILLEGEGHGSARRSSQVMEYGHTLRFFESTCSGKKSGSADSLTSNDQDATCGRRRPVSNGSVSTGARRGGGRERARALSRGTPS